MIPSTFRNSSARFLLDKTKVKWLFLDLTNPNVSFDLLGIFLFRCFGNGIGHVHLAEPLVYPYLLLLMSVVYRVGPVSGQTYLGDA